MRQAAGIALCLVGVVVIVTRGDPETLLQLAFTAGDLWTVLATVGWALYSVLLKFRPSKLDLTVRFAVITGAGLLTMLPFLGLEMALGHVAVFDARTVGIWVFLALVPGLGAYLLYGKLVAMVGPGRTGLLMYLVPVYIAGLAYVLLGEMPRIFHLVGILLILPGIWLATSAWLARNAESIWMSDSVAGSSCAAKMAPASRACGHSAAHTASAKSGSGASLMKTGQSTLVMVSPQRAVTRGSTPSVPRLTAPIASAVSKASCFTQLRARS